MKLEGHVLSGPSPPLRILAQESRVHSVSNKTVNEQPSQSESARQIVRLVTTIAQVLRHCFIPKSLLCLAMQLASAWHVCGAGRWQLAEVPPHSEDRGHFLLCRRDVHDSIQHVISRQWRSTSELDQHRQASSGVCNSDCFMVEIPTWLNASSSGFFLAKLELLVKAGLSPDARRACFARCCSGIPRSFPCWAPWRRISRNDCQHVAFGVDARRPSVAIRR